MTVMSVWIIPFKRVYEQKKIEMKIARGIYFWLANRETILCRICNTCPQFLASFSRLSFSAAALLTLQPLVSCVFSSEKEDTKQREEVPKRPAGKFSETNKKA